MKKLCVILAAIMATCFAACTKSQSKTSDADNEKKSLVVYFSATGTTKAVAEKIAAAAEADLVEIEPTELYTPEDLDWHNKQSRSSLEMNDASSRPSIKNQKIDFSRYGKVFLGFPIWWDLAPREVNTFIEDNDMKGVTVIPFATSGGSSIDNSAMFLKNTYPEINWREGYLLNEATDGSISEWLDSLK